MLLRGKHKTRDNTNEIEMRDNNNFHRIIFQVFEHCLSALYSHFDFFIVIWHTHRRNIFTPHAVRIHHNFYQHQKCCSALFILFLTVFFLLRRLFFIVATAVFSFSIKSTFCHNCGMWFWCTLILVFPVRQTVIHHYSNGKRRVWNHIVLSYYVSGCIHRYI